MKREFDFPKKDSSYADKVRKISVEAGADSAAPVLSIEFDLQPNPLEENVVRWLLFVKSSIEGTGEDTFDFLVRREGQSLVLKGNLLNALKHLKTRQIIDEVHLTAFERDTTAFQLLQDSHVWRLQSGELVRVNQTDPFRPVAVAPQSFWSRENHNKNTKLIKSIKALDIEDLRMLESLIEREINKKDTIQQLGFS